MVSTAAFAEIAALAGDPARANMLTALMDGGALTAAELARAAAVAPQTASGHLARMTEAGLLVVAKQGRHRYHRLATPAVAGMIESIMAVAEGGQAAARIARPLVVGPRDAAMRAARTCYDHLAGKLGVGIADAMVERGHIELAADGGAVTSGGEAFLGSLGVELPARRPLRSGRGGERVYCRPCLDWSERRPHVAGAVGAALCSRCFQLGWIRRIEGSRALAITPSGVRALRQTFGIES